MDCDCSVQNGRVGPVHGSSHMMGTDAGDELTTGCSPSKKVVVMEQKEYSEISFASAGIRAI